MLLWQTVVPTYQGSSKSVGPSGIYNAHSLRRMFIVKILLATDLSLIINDILTWFILINFGKMYYQSQSFIHHNFLQYYFCLLQFFLFYHFVGDLQLSLTSISFATSH